MNEIFQRFVQYTFNTKSLNTVITYSAHIRDFTAFLINNNINDFSMITEEITDTYLELKKNKIAPNSYNIICTSLSQFFDYLISQEILLSNFAKNKRIDGQNVKIVKTTEKDVEKFLNLIKYKPLRIRCAFYTVLGTGARISEVSNLRRDDFIVNSDGQYLININNAKWNSNRIVPFLNAHYGKMVYDFISKLLYNFCPFPPVRNLQYYCKFYGNRLNFTVTPHSLRHYFAYDSINAGYPIEAIQYNLGHTTAAMSSYYAVPGNDFVILKAPSIL